MRWLHRNLPWLLLAALAATTAAFAATLIVGPLVVLATLLSGASTATTFGSFAAVSTVLTLLAALDAAVATGLVVTVVRRASLPTSPRLARTARALETAFPILRDAGLSRRFEPTVAERKRRLKRRYVEGDLTEREFERELRELLVETEPPPMAADGRRQIGRVDGRVGRGPGGGERAEDLRDPERE